MDTMQLSFAAQTVQMPLPTLAVNAQWEHLPPYTYKGAVGDPAMLCRFEISGHQCSHWQEMACCAAMFASTLSKSKLFQLTHLNLRSQRTMLGMEAAVA